MKRKLFATSVFSIGLAVSGTLCAAGVSNTLDANACPGGNTPLTAYAWSSPDNWTDKVVGAPMSYGDTAIIGKPTSTRWIDMGDGVKVSYFNFDGSTEKESSGNLYLGDVWVGAIPDEARGMIGNRYGWIFGNVYMTGYNGSFGYVNGQIAGRFSGAQKDVPGVVQNSNWGIANGALNIRCDLFADDANPVRADPIDWTGYNTSQADFYFYGPKGAEAQDSNWTLTAGSPYLLYAGSGSHGVVPGSVVTGDGVAPNTFVRYVLHYGTGWIALSNPIAPGVSGVKTLHFSAITPSVETTFTHSTLNANCTVAAYKYREQDGCKLTLSGVQVRNKWTKLGVSDKSFIPGDMVVNFFSTSADATHYIDLLNVRLVFERSYATPQYPYFTLGAGKTARLTVKNGISTTLTTFKDMCGTLEKCGPGSLSINMVSGLNPTEVKVQEGRLSIASETAGSIPSLVLGAGSVFKIPAGGLTVGSITAGVGATLEGPGTVMLTGTLTGSLRFAGGAEISMPNTRADVLESRHPWVVLDATDYANSEKMVTYQENGTNFVSRWYDALGSGHFVERRNAMSGTSQYFPYGAGDCWIRENANSGMPYVDMGPFCCTNLSGSLGALSGVDRSLRLFKPDGSAYALGKEDDKPYIRASFFAVGTEYGGGSLLGAGGSDFSSIGGLVHGKAQKDAPIICFDDDWYSDPSLGNKNFRWSRTYLDSGTSTFRVNGVKTYPLETPFSGNFDVITAMSGNAYRSACLGYCGQDNTPKYEKSTGGLLYGEVILLTNAVTAAQATEIENYLRWKWRGERAAGAYPELETLELDADSTFASLVVAATTVGGSGSISGGFELTGSTFKAKARADGTFEPLTVTGRAKLPAAVTVVLDASAVTSGKLTPGTYTLLSAGLLDAAGTIWQVDGPENRSYKVFVDGNDVKLEIHPKGLLLFLR